MIATQSNDSNAKHLSIDTTVETLEYGNPNGVKRTRFPPLSPEHKIATSPPSISLPSPSIVHSTGRSYSSSPVVNHLHRNDSDNGSAHFTFKSHPKFLVQQPLYDKEDKTSEEAAPVNHVLMEARDEFSHAGASHFDLDSAYQSFFNTAHAQDQQMDEIIIQKYIAEKNKCRAMEANNELLQGHIHEITKQMETHCLEANKEVNAISMKLEQQFQVKESLEETIKELKEKLQSKEEQTDRQVASLRDEGEKKVQATRDEGELKLNSLRKEMMELQKKYGAAKSRLDQEIEKADEFTKRYKAMEHVSDDRRKQIEKEQGKVKILEQKLNQLQICQNETEIESHSKIEFLSNKIKTMEEEYEFQKQRAEEFSSELKIMSYQYVENLEKLEAEEKKSKQCIQDLDNTKAELAEVTRKHGRTLNELEEMAKGFIETDNLLAKESEMASKLSHAMNAINTQLHDEVTKSKELESQVAMLKKAKTESQHEATKLREFSNALSAELKNVQQKVANVISNSTQLTDVLTKTKQKLETTEASLEESQSSNNTLVEELASLKKENEVLRDDLDRIKRQLQIKQEFSENVSKKLQKQSDMYINLEQNMMQEKSETERLLQGKSEMVKELSINLEGMIKKCKQQDEYIMKLQDDTNKLSQVAKTLSEEIEQVKEAKSELEQSLEAEREEYNDKVEDTQEKLKLTRHELDELENKHSVLLNNLIETEDILINTKEELKIATMRLETKDQEFKPIETMLQDEIKKRDEHLKEEQDKNILLTSQNVEMNRKCKKLYADLVEAEEKILHMEEKLNSLKNQIIAKDQECKNLEIDLEKERNSPHQRKIKVAKKMIQAEKNRYRAIQKEIEAKDLIIKRMEDQTEKHGSEVQRLQKELEQEVERGATHSRRALQEMQQELESEKKKMKNEREKLQNSLRSEKANVKSLITQLKTLEKAIKGEEISNVLTAIKDNHEVEERLRNLTADNERLVVSLKEKEELVAKHEYQLAEVTRSLQDLTNYMDTMVQYCYGLEEEKLVLKRQIQNMESNGNSSSSPNLFNLLEGNENSDNDDDTVSGMSLSDFSIAQIPSSLKMHRSHSNLMSRTNIVSPSIDDILRSIDTGVELTVD